MVRQTQFGGHWAAGTIPLLVLLCLGGWHACAQTTTPASAAPQSAPAQSASQSAPVKAAPAPLLPKEQGTELDRVVAIVNGDLILDSDVDQERRFSDLLPYGEAAQPHSRDKAIERLINRDLILQQSHLQPQDEITRDAAAVDLDSLRKELPTCKENHCATQAGWDKFLASEGFTEDSIVTLWQERMQVLAFIERRFRMGIKITPDEIKTYYEKTMLPQYAAQHVTAPALDTLSTRIQEVLLQQQVSNLLSDWLESLRAQGSVVVLHPGEGAP